MITDLHLYVDSQARQLVKGPQDKGKFVFPPAYQGDTLNIFLHGVRPNTDPDSLDVYEEAPISFTGIKCGIGIGADAVPSGGTFKIRLIGQTEATQAFAFNADHATVLAALNALPTVQAVSAQGLKLDNPTPAAPNFFLIRWVDPTVTHLFEIVENYLEPFCFTRSVVRTLAYGQIQILKFIVAPYAFTDQFAYPASAAATTDSVRLGSSTQNCVQSLTVPASAMGSLSLTFASNATTLISVADLQGSTDGSSALAAALNGLYSDGETRFGVTRYANGVYYIELLGPLAKADFPVMDVTMHGQVPLDTPVGALPLDRPDLELAMHGQKQLTLLFELEITDGGNVVTIQQSSVVIINDMLDSGMALEASPSWLAQVDPTYQPYDPNGAAVVGYRSYVTALGSGVANGTTSGSFVVTHNLGTQNCHVTVRETGGTRHRIPDVQYVCTFVNDDQVRIDFAGVPGYEWDTLPLDGQFEVVISSAVAQDLALPHHTHPISDVEGLQAELDSLANGINPDAPIPANRLPLKIPWYTYDANGKPNGFRFDVVPDGLLPSNIPRLIDGRLPAGILPLGTPYLDANGNLVVDLPGPPPSTLVILDSSGHFPGERLPADPASWPGLLDAILNVLQNGAPVPKGFIPMTIPPVALSLPADVKLRPGEAAVPATLPRALPAFTASGPVTGALPMPATGLSNTVVTVGGTGASAAAVRYRAPQVFDAGAVVGCDGMQYFPVFLDGGNAYPSEMEVELFTVHVAPNMLVSGSRFLCNATVQLGLSGPCAGSVRAAYFLRVRFGHVNGPLLSTVTWDSDAIMQQIVVSSATVLHTFGVAVTKALDGTRTATMDFYGRDTGIVAPPSDDFVVKATLTKFDLEDVAGLNIGQINVKMPTALASIALLS